MAITTSGSLSGSQLQIGIALVLHDRFTNEARTASKEIHRLHEEAKAAVVANLQMADSLLSTGRDFFTGVARGLWNIVEEGNVFIDTMTTVGAITQATEEQLSRLSNTAQTLGLETMFGSVDIASGMKYLAMAGNTADEINNMIRGAAMVAGATGMELAGKGGSADLITNIMRMFRVEASEASTVVGDQLTKATLSANMSMTDLAEAIKYAGADMVTLGQTLPQVSALIGVLGDAGIQGSMAGTAIGNMARYLNKSISEEGYKGFRTLATLGLSKSDFLNAKGELIDFADILGKIKNAMEMRGMSPVDMNSTLLNIFGVRGNRAAVALMNNLDRYNQLLASIYDSEGFAESVMEERMSSLAGATDALLNSFENLRTTFAEALEPILVPLFKVVGDFMGVIRDIIATPFGKWAAGITTAVTAAGLLGTTLGAVRAKLLLLKTDSLVNGTSMWTLMTTGWRNATISAKQYSRMLGMIQAQSKNNNLSGLVEYVKSGGIIGNIGWKAGRFYYTDRGIGTFAKTRDALDILNRHAQSNRLNMDAMMNVASYGGYNKSARYRSLIMRYGSASAARAAMSGIGGIGGIAARFAMGGLGLLGGPVGIGIMGISILLPALISWIKKSKESTDENTYSVLTLAGKYKTESERIAARKSLRITEELAAATNLLLKVSNDMDNIVTQVNSKGLQLNVYDSDGNIITTSNLPVNLEKNLQKLNNSAGIR